MLRRTNNEIIYVQYNNQPKAFKEAAEHPAEKRYIIIIRIHGKKFFSEHFFDFFRIYRLTFLFRVLI